MNEIDLIVRLQHSLSGPAGRAFIGFVARWLIFLYIPFAGFIRLSTAARQAVYGAGWTALVALSMSTVLAQLLGRVRPYLASPHIQAIVPPNIQDGSFPSSHTAVAVGIALALSQINMPVGVSVGIMAALVAFGRVASGMHFPSDVLGGAAVGVLAYVLVKAVQEGLTTV